MHTDIAANIKVFRKYGGNSADLGAGYAGKASLLNISGFARKTRAGHADLWFGAICPPQVWLIPKGGLVAGCVSARERGSDSILMHE
jgi:hypothetical protein